MRTRTLITGAAFLVAGFAGAGTASAQQALTRLGYARRCDRRRHRRLPGRDRQHRLRRRRLGRRPVGDVGRRAPTQHVSPMSRQLNGAQCTANSRQLLIGLDGLSIVAKNSTGGTPATCTDDIGGGAPRSHRRPVAVHPVHDEHAVHQLRHDVRHRAPVLRSGRHARAGCTAAAGLLARRDVHVRQRHRQRGRRLAGRGPPDLRRHEPHHRRDARSTTRPR